jgi:hypothetical protein
MKIKIFMLLLLGMTAAGLCHAQSANPSMGSESSSTGVWPSVSQEHSDSAGYGSGDHGNVS